MWTGQVQKKSTLALEMTDLLDMIPAEGQVQDKKAEIWEGAILINLQAQDLEVGWKLHLIIQPQGPQLRHLAIAARHQDLSHHRLVHPEEIPENLARHRHQDHLGAVILAEEGRQEVVVAEILQEANQIFFLLKHFWGKSI